MRDPQIQSQVLEAIRGLAAYGLGSGIGGHVSVRVPGQRMFYINAFEKTFEEMQQRDIALLNFDGEVVECETTVSPGQTFHHGIYKQRPDVNAIVHTHGFWITSQSALGRPPRNLHNLCTYFDGRTCISPSDDFTAIGPALKDSDLAIVIPWHGAITVAGTLGDAAALHVTLDYACRLDVTLPQDTPVMPEHLVQEMRRVLGKANYLDLTWNLIRRKGIDFFNGTRVIPSPVA
ncbi:MAG: class II aldolase/adducin family protein [Rhodoferax sp.]|nr:class II aldolase/adducin family protein [Rhodoferax sp.]